MTTHINFPELIPDEIIARASKLNPALLCDGMKDMGIMADGCMEASMLPVEISMKVVGTAMTVRTSEGDNFPIHVATYAASPGYVMVIDGGDFKERAYFGDLIINAAKAVGFSGIVVDGLCRDREGCIEIDLPVFSKGFIQRGPIKSQVGDINIPIKCGGVLVNPGDLICGGADGVTVVPREHLLTVLDKAEEKLAYEQMREQSIRMYEDAKKQKAYLPDLAPKWVRDMLEK